jgi:hypothetical protein
MQEPNWKTRIGNEWKDFAGVIGNPWVLSLGVFTLLLLAASANQTETMLSFGLSLIASLASGVLGASVEKRWEDITEGGKMRALGDSAVRSLVLSLNSVAALRSRVTEYLHRHSIETTKPQTTQFYLEDTIERCILLEEQTLKSIEDWKEITPSADVLETMESIYAIREKIESLRTLRTTQQEQMADMETSQEKTEVAQATAQNLQESQRLLQKLLETEMTLRDRNPALAKYAKMAIAMMEEEGATIRQGKGHHLISTLYVQAA